MKITKFFTILSVTVILCWVFYLAIYPKINNRKDVEIPDVYNNSLNEAKTKLKDSDLRFKIVEVENSNKVSVLYSMPEVGSIVKSKSIVTLYITKQEEIILDDFTNVLYCDVKTEIEEFCSANKIKLFVDEIVDNDLPEGIIVSQSQEPYNKITSKVLTIKVVKHDNKFEFPDLVGKDIEEAIELIGKYDLNINYVYEYSLEPYGVIIAQSIKPNTKVIKGNKNEIIIYVSKGMGDDSVFQGMNCDLALFYLNKVKYDIIYIDSNEVSNKVIAIDKNLYYDNNSEKKLYIYVTK